MHGSPNQGLFFSYGGLYWSISAPNAALVGQPGGASVADGTLTRIETSTQNNRFMEAEFTDGHRFEIGVMKGSKGWIWSSFQLDAQNQLHEKFGSAGNTDVLFDDPPQGALGIGLLDGFTDVLTQGPPGTILPNVPDGYDDDRNGNGIFGRSGQDTDADGVPDAIAPTDYDDLVRMPVRFSYFSARNQTKVWGTELMRIFRTKQFHHGGYFDIMLGVRYMRFDDDFLVQGWGGHRADTVAGQIPDGDLLIDSITNAYWDTDAENNIVGPQIAIRWAKEVSRLTLSSEARFCAGVNFQSIQQNGSFASDIIPGAANYPLFMAATNFRHNYHTEEFSPIIELRFQASYDLTKCISVRGGWTGMYTEGIARASDMIEYTLPNMGININNNTQDVWVQGLNLAIEWNR
ncbi:MAG: BBP7 family outer membrane beta-barrel protein [Pirellulales bacterium]